MADHREGHESGSDEAELHRGAQGKLAARVLYRLAGLFLLAIVAGCLGPLGQPKVRNNILPSRPLVLWIDWAGTAEVFRNADAANDFAAKAKGIGVTHFALEARDRSGRPSLGNQSVYRLQERQLRGAAKRQGIRLAAAVPLFVANDDTPAELRCMAAFGGDGDWELVPGDALTPVLEENRERELDLIASVASDPEFDFLILSQPGFGNLYADFSPAAKRAFEAWTGRTASRWPGQVLGEPAPPSPQREGKGAFWDVWLLWRGDLMLDFMLEVQSRLSTIESAPFVVAVEAPWPSHVRDGLNWAMPDSRAARDHGWLPRQHDRTAAGHLLPGVALIWWEPVLILASDAESADFAWWASMEGSTALARRYRRSGDPVWGVVPLMKTPRPKFTVEAAKKLGDGVVLLSASEFVNNPTLWDEISPR